MKRIVRAVVVICFICTQVPCNLLLAGELQLTPVRQELRPSSAVTAEQLEAAQTVVQNVILSKNQLPPESPVSVAVTEPLSTVAAGQDLDTSYVPEAMLVEAGKFDSQDPDFNIAADRSDIYSDTNMFKKEGNLWIGAMYKGYGLNMDLEDLSIQAVGGPGLGSKSLYGAGAWAYSLQNMVEDAVNIESIFRSNNDQPNAQIAAKTVSFLKWVQAAHLADAYDGRHADFDLDADPGNIGSTVNLYKGNRILWVFADYKGYGIRLKLDDLSIQGTGGQGLSQAEPYGTSGWIYSLKSMIEKTEDIRAIFQQKNDLSSAAIVAQAVEFLTQLLPADKDEIRRIIDRITVAMPITSVVFKGPGLPASFVSFEGSSFTLRSRLALWKVDTATGIIRVGNRTYKPGTLAYRLQLEKVLLSVRQAAKRNITSINGDKPTADAVNRAIVMMNDLYKSLLKFRRPVF